MRALAKSTLGVTLLEIMLVLAIAAMIIVMSIRYYDSATTSQQANTTLQQVQAIIVTMDNLGMGSNSYVGISQSDIESLLGAASMRSVTNERIIVEPVSDAIYRVTIPLNTPICTSVRVKLEANSKITNAACTNGVLTYSYDHSI